MAIVVRSPEEVDNILKKVVEVVDKALTQADLSTSRAIEYNARVIEIMEKMKTTPNIMDSLRDIAEIAEVIYVVRAVPQLTEYLPTVPRAITQLVQETRERMCRSVGISLDLTRPCTTEEITEAIRTMTEATKVKIGLNTNIETLEETIPVRVRRAVGKELLLLNRALLMLGEAYAAARDAYVITSNIDTSMLPREMEREALRKIREVRDAYTLLPVTVSMLRTALTSMLNAYVKIALRLGITSKNLLNIILSLRK